MAAFGWMCRIIPIYFFKITTKCSEACFLKVKGGFSLKSSIETTVSILEHEPGLLAVRCLSFHIYHYLRMENNVVELCSLKQVLSLANGRPFSVVQ